MNGVFVLGKWSSGSSGSSDVHAMTIAVAIGIAVITIAIVRRCIFGLLFGRMR